MIDQLTIQQLVYLQSLLKREQDQLQQAIDTTPPTNQGIIQFTQFHKNMCNELINVIEKQLR